MTISIPAVPYIFVVEQFFGLYEDAVHNVIHVSLSKAEAFHAVKNIKFPDYEDFQTLCITTWLDGKIVRIDQKTDTPEVEGEWTIKTFNN